MLGPMTGHLFAPQDTASLHGFEVSRNVRPIFVPPPERQETGTPADRSPSNRLRQMAVASAGIPIRQSIRSFVKIGNREVRGQRFGRDGDLDQRPRRAGKGALESRREIRRLLDPLARHPVRPSKGREIRI